MTWFQAAAAVAAGRDVSCTGRRGRHWRLPLARAVDLRYGVRMSASIFGAIDRGLFGTSSSFGLPEEATR